MGRNGVNALLKLASLPSLIENYPSDTAEPAFAFSTVSNLTEMLEQAYGPHGGRGLALRIGRACFNYGVRQYSTQLGLTQMAFRLLPLPSKLHAGTSAFAELFNNFTDQRVRVEEHTQGQPGHETEDPRAAKKLLRVPVPQIGTRGKRAWKVKAHAERRGVKHHVPSQPRDSHRQRREEPKADDHRHGHDERLQREERRRRDRRATEVEVLEVVPGAVGRLVVVLAVNAPKGERG